MPKRGRRYTPNNGNKQPQANYDEHDDRVRDRRTIRHVTFKTSVNQPKGALKSRTAELALRARLEDDDDMGGRFENDRGDIRRRKGSPIPGNVRFGDMRLRPNMLGWYQVTINWAQKYTKEEILRQILAAMSPEVFIPLYWRHEKQAVVFFVDDHRIAVILQGLNRTVKMSDGFKLSIRVRTGTPHIIIDDEYKERVKVAMAKRYNPTTKALDLTKFWADPDFKNVFFTLIRPPIMACVADIIVENIPDLVALNLSNNNLSSADSLRILATKLPNLKILHLNDNKFHLLPNLLGFQHHNIIELSIANNPFRFRLKENSSYISEVRKKFPKLIKLDNKELEPLVQFDTEASTLLPTRASFLCHQDGSTVVRQFLEQYFTIFDSENRQPLLDAYHEQAMLSVAIPPISQAGKLTAFAKCNRNLKRYNNEADATRFLKFGRLPVVSALVEWPKTQHDMQSFTVDLTLFTPKMMSFTVAGLFKEFDVELGPSTSQNSKAVTRDEIRYFQRHLIVVPANGGLCIRNELILVTSATYLQIKKAFKLQPTPAPPQTFVVNNPTGIPAVPPVGTLQNRLMVNQDTTQQAVPLQLPQQQQQPVVPDDAVKMQMIQAISTFSSMNLDWSKKCLEQTNWDYNHAVYVFNKLNKDNQIPAEAFAK